MEKEKGRTSKTLENMLFKDPNHTIILCCNIISCRDAKRQSAEETQIAKCDSDCSNKEKMSRLMTTYPAEGVGIKSICFRCRNASNDNQSKGIRANEF